VILRVGVEVFRPLRELRVLLHEGMRGLAAARGIFALLDARPAVQDRVPGPEPIDASHRLLDEEATRCRLPDDLAAHRILSFERGSISRFVIRTSPKTCVHSETMLPTTCPHFDSESIHQYRAIHPRPVVNRKILRE
jgi:hypothetical protein